MKLISDANNIEDTGVSSAYDGDFEKMEKTLEVGGTWTVRKGNDQFRT